MEFLGTLAIPIVLSAVIVFVMSALIHMVLGYHAGDFKKVPKEDGVMDALRPFNLSPGDYAMPYCAGPKEMKSPELQEKWKKGPIALLTVFPSGEMKMGKQLGLWFIFNLIVAIFVAYLASRTCPPGTHYLQVFRVVGCATFMAYALGLMQSSIWYGRSWGGTLRTMFDGLIYAMLSAGVFGWLWPKM